MTGESDMDDTKYCATEDITNRLLIRDDDVSQYQVDIDYAIIEASRMVDIFLKPYITVPISGTVPDQVVIVTADFASSIFKRRYIPDDVKIKGALQPDMINDVDGTGWFAVGLKKLLDFIKSYYALSGNEPVSEGVLTNPDVFKLLFAQGMITLKEARAYMANTSGTIQEAINKISTLTTTKIDVESLTRAEDITHKETDTVVKTETDTEALTRTEVITKTPTIHETKTLSDTQIIEVTKTPVTHETKTLSDTKVVADTETVVSNKTLTESSYPTKRQKDFGFIKGKVDNAGGYVKEEETSS